MKKPLLIECEANELFGGFWSFTVWIGPKVAWSSDAIA